MGSNIPRTVEAFVNWADAHKDLWDLSAPQIGLSPSQATLYKNMVSDLKANLAAAVAARTASKNATMAFNQTLTEGRALTGAYVAMIKAFAETTGNMNVYDLAGISPNDGPGTLPLPVPPKEIFAGVNSDGSLKITWKVSQPEGVTGVTYLVSRRYNTSTGPFAIVGSGTSKSFTDSTLPVGVDTVQYIIQPKRGNDLGEQSAVFSLQFGSVSGDGFVNVTTSPSAGMKIAA